MSESIYGRWENVLPRIAEEFAEKLRSWNEEQKAVRGSGVWDHLLCRVKDEESMREKCRGRGLPETTESALTAVHDAIGFRVVTRFVDDIYRTAEAVRHMEGCEVAEEKDYITSAKENGYRSYHMILKLSAPEEDIQGRTPGIYWAELQLRTIAMDTWASLEHEMRYKKNVRNTALISSELKRCADELASCDLSMQTIRDLIRENNQ